MALIVMALIVVAIAWFNYGQAKSLWSTPHDPRFAMLRAYAGGFLDAFAVLLIGYIAGSLLL